ncbi:unnamed protein product [Cylicocyclus nassatus]|uniref:Fucosyltransferase n=1 Tax=Cylicocyclus nassatus TaxID=53992 RepID=A0AA36HBZ6_CYLNA|nr:unnamed protein product [Cylicocyclus nassatus]
MWFCERQIEHDFKFLHFNQTFFATEVLTTYPIKLEERMKCNADAKAPPKLILSWNAGFSQENLGGCPDWNCKLIDDEDRIGEADAVLFSNEISDNVQRKPDQYFIYYSQKYFPIDIYGACGELKCPRRGNCINDLNEEYHFYIAFKNLICKDYVTEKLWNQGYQYDIVPIVLKRTLVEKLAPPNSFIAADDFNTTKDLADYLHYLMRNKSAYA